MRRLILCLVLLCTAQASLAVAAYVRGVQARLARALGSGPGFGGDVPTADLPGYRFGNKVHARYARYRIALGWPALGMGQFMGIINAPSAIDDTLDRVARAPVSAP